MYEYQGMNNTRELHNYSTVGGGGAFRDQRRELLFECFLITSFIHLLIHGSQVRYCMNLTLVKLCLYWQWEGPRAGHTHVEGHTTETISFIKFPYCVFSVSVDAGVAALTWTPYGMSQGGPRWWGNGRQKAALSRHAHLHFPGLRVLVCGIKINGIKI